MCIVVDINTLSPVFNSSCEEHSEFVHVKNWIDKGYGFLVFGGTKFKKELMKTERYLRLIRKMKDAGFAVAIQDDIVDKEEERVKALTDGTDCDDQHIIGLLCASRCPLVCSKDARSYKYLTDRSLYSNKMARVRIYSSSRNTSLLKRPISQTKLKNQV